MEYPHPSVFKPELTTERLQQVATWLLEELYATEEDLSRPTDNGYTRGCAAFGRQRNRLINEYLSRKHPWLGMSNSSNDLVFTVGEVPCRFSNDDPANPSKDAVLTANRYQIPLLEAAADDEPGRFCFVIDRGVDGSSEPVVEFLGFSPSGEIVCRWVSDAVRVLRVEGNQPLPGAVPVAKPPVGPKRKDQDKEAKDDGDETGEVAK